MSDLNARLSININPATTAGMQKLIAGLADIDSKLSKLNTKPALTGTSKGLQYNTDLLKEYRSALRAGSTQSLEFIRTLDSLDKKWRDAGKSEKEVIELRKRYAAESKKAAAATNDFNKALKARAAQAKLDVKAGTFDAAAYRADISKISNARRLFANKIEGSTPIRQGVSVMASMRKGLSSLSPELSMILSRVSILQETLAPLTGDLLTAGNGMGMMGAAGMALNPVLLGLTAAAIGFGAAVASVSSAINSGIQAYAPFEKALTELGVLGDLTQRQVSGIKDAVVDLSMTFPEFDTTGITNKVIDLVKGGRSAGESLQFMSASMLAAKATGEDLDAVVSAGNAVTKAFNVSIQETPSLFAAITASANATESSFTSVAAPMTEMSGIAKMVNADMVELASIMGIAGDLQIEGSKLARAYSSSLSRLAAPTRQAKETMDQYGISLTDADGKIKPFIKIIEELNQKLTGGAQERLAAFSKIIGKEHGKTIAALAGKADQLQEIYRKVGLAAKSALVVKKEDIPTFINESVELLAVDKVKEKVSATEKELADMRAAYTKEGLENTKEAQDAIYDKQQDLEKLNKQIALDSALKQVAEDYENGLIGAEEALRRIDGLQKDIARASGGDLEGMAEAMAKNYETAAKALENMRNLGQQMAGEQVIKTQTREVQTQTEARRELIDEGVFKKQGELLDSIASKWVGFKAEMIKLGEYGKVALFWTIDWLQKIGAGIGQLLPVIGILGGALLAMVNPAAGIAVLGLSLAGLGQKAKVLVPILGTVSGILIALVNPVLGVGIAVTSLAAGIGINIKDIGDWFAWLAAAVPVYMDNVDKTMTAWMDEQIANLLSFLDWLDGALTTAADNAISWIIYAGKSILARLNWIDSVMTAFLDTVLENFSKGWNALPSIVVSVFKGIGTYIGDWAKSIGSVISAMFHNLMNPTDQKEVPVFVKPQLKLDPNGAIPKFSSMKMPTLEVVPKPNLKAFEEKPPKIKVVPELTKVPTEEIIKAQRDAARETKKVKLPDTGGGAGDKPSDDTGDGGGVGDSGGGRGGKGRAAKDKAAADAAEKRIAFSKDQAKLQAIENELTTKQAALQDQVNAKIKEHQNVLRDITTKERERLKDANIALDANDDQLSLQRQRLDAAVEQGRMTEAERLAADDMLARASLENKYAKELLSIEGQKLDLQEQQEKNKIAQLERDKEISSKNLEIENLQAQQIELASQKAAFEATNKLTTEELEGINKDLLDVQDKINAKIAERKDLLDKNKQATLEEKDAVTIKQADIERAAAEAKRKRDVESTMLQQQMYDKQLELQKKQSEATFSFTQDGLKFVQSLKENFDQIWEDGKITFDEVIGLLQSTFDQLSKLTDQAGEIGKMGGGGLFSWFKPKDQTGGGVSRRLGFVGQNAEGLTKGFKTEKEAASYGNVIGSLVETTDGAVKQLKVFDTSCGIAASKAGDLGEGVALAGASLEDIFSGKRQISAGEVSATSTAAKTGGGGTFSFGKIFSIASTVTGVIGAFFKKKQQEEQKKIEKQVNKFKQRLSEIGEQVAKVDNDLYSEGLVSISNRIKVRYTALSQTVAEFNKLSKKAKKEVAEEFKKEIEDLQRSIKELQIEKGRLVDQFNMQVALTGVKKEFRGMVSSINELFTKTSEMLLEGYNPAGVQKIFEDELKTIQEDAFKPLNDRLEEISKERSEMVADAAAAEADRLKSLTDELKAIQDKYGFTEQLTAEQEMKAALAAASKEMSDAGKSSAEQLEKLATEESELLARRAEMLAQYNASIAAAGAKAQAMMAAGSVNKYYENLGNQIGDVSLNPAAIMSGVTNAMQNALDTVGTQIGKANIGL